MDTKRLVEVKVDFVAVKGSKPEPHIPMLFCLFICCFVFSKKKKAGKS
jgi:hypothetical protein